MRLLSASPATEARTVCQSDALARWQGRVARVLEGWQQSRTPLITRERLRDRVRLLASQWTENDFLLLVFGSIARAEPSRDVDLLVVTGQGGIVHEYSSLTTAGIAVDLNVAPRDWLAEAWTDPEWGYWLSESYVLHASSEDMEEIWRRSVNRYWGQGLRRERASAHRRAAEDLLAAAREAHAGGARNCAALLQHEAVRAVGVALIELHGTRAYSHRSFIGELRHACRRCGLSPQLEATLVASLGVVDLRQGAVEYPHLRGALSALLRSSRACMRNGYSPTKCRDKRRRSLLAAWSSDAGLLEAELEEAGVPLHPFSPEVVEVLARAWCVLDVAPHGSALAQFRREAVAFRPERSAEAGVRWRALEGRRLKLIVDTGGCRTPTCSFCDLPAFATRSRRVRIAPVVAAALNRDRPDELALYNDGSLLNPDEVDPDDLEAICQAVAHHRVGCLSIESVPRFVTRARVESVLSASAVRSLVVAMGFQSVGNGFSMGRLGRPDADALFERAIDIVHEAGARVRLYLLWGYHEADVTGWAERLGRSIEWACKRDVDIITICPYLPTSPGRASPPPLCSLWSVLASRGNKARDRITLSLPAEASCGEAGRISACEPCRRNLGANNWRDVPPPLKCPTRSAQ